MHALLCMSMACLLQLRGQVAQACNKLLLLRRITGAGRTAPSTDVDGPGRPAPALGLGLQKGTTPLNPGRDSGAPKAISRVPSLSTGLWLLCTGLKLCFYFAHWVKLTSPTLLAVSHTFQPDCNPQMLARRLFLHLTSAWLDL